MRRRRARKNQTREQPAADSKQNGDAAKSEATRKTRSPRPHQAIARPKPKTNGKPKLESTAKSKEKSQTPKHDKVRLAMLTLKSSMPETSGQAGPFGETQLDLRETINRLEKAAKDKSVSGVVLDIHNPEIGRGKIDELRGAISRFRASGKKVYATIGLGHAGRLPRGLRLRRNRDARDAAMLMLPGVHAEATFYKGLLAQARHRGRLHPHRRLQGRRRAAHAREVQRTGPREHERR